jgi:hypothetical protein
MRTVRSIVSSVRMSESGIPVRRHRTVTTACSAANPWIRYAVRIRLIDG